MYHLGFDDAMGATIAILPGDPGRVPLVANKLGNPEQIAQNREFNTYIGYLDNKPIIVTSTGIGGPSAAIAAEELFQLGINTFIRVGTCGGMADSVLAGDIVIAEAAVRAEGTSLEYAPIEFPALADFEVTSALKTSADKLGYRSHIGVVHCKDSFYGQHSPERMPVGPTLLKKWDAWLKLGCLASEMESAAIYTVARSLGARAGCLLYTVWNQERRRKFGDESESHDTEKAILTAIEAAKIIS